MGLLNGKVSKRKLVKSITTKLPDNVEEIDGKYYKDGKELKSRQLTFWEAFEKHYKDLVPDSDYDEYREKK